MGQRQLENPFGLLGTFQNLFGQLTMFSANGLSGHIVANIQAKLGLTVSGHPLGG